LRVMTSILLSSYDSILDTQEDWHPIALAAKSNSEGTPSWHEAMHGPDTAGYWKACENKIHTLQDIKDSWEIQTLS
jgi:hypothetical protein